MRIALIPTPNLHGYSGSRNYGRELAVALARRGHDVHAFLNTAIDLPGVKVHLTGSQLPHPIEEDHHIPRAVFLEDACRIATRVVEEVDAQGWDVVHSFYASFTALAGGNAASVLQVPHVVSCFGRDLNPGMVSHDVHRGLAVAGLALADGVVAASEAVAERVRRLRPDIPLLSLPVGLDVNKLRSQMELGPPADWVQSSDGRVVVALFSSVLPEKRVRWLVEALAPLLQERPDVQLLLVGPLYDGGTGEAASLRRSVEASGLRDRVRIVGRRPHHEIPQWLSLATLAIDARSVPNFSSSALEAVAAGVPCLFSDALRQQFQGVEQRPCAWFGVDDVKGLREEARRLLDDGSARDSLRREAAAWWTTNGARFSLDENSADLIRFYNQARDARAARENAALS
jgi:L-malate glycosyltransferase